jgi:hypothetical protein
MNPVSSTSHPPGDERLTGRTYCVLSARTLASRRRGRVALLTREHQSRDDEARRGGPQDGRLLGIIYFVLLVTLGVLSLRKGHWIMFIVGLFIPLFWLIGALLPRRVARM